LVPDTPSSNSSSPSSSGKEKHQPVSISISKGMMGYNYAEIHRIRESIVTALQEKNKKTVLITSPHDDAGNTFLISLLGFNIASFSNLRVLLVDLNMRRSELHLPFGLKMEKGFTEVASGLLNWKETIKDTKLLGLKIMTAGQTNGDLYRFLNHTLLDGMIQKMKEDFDLILFDTSPVLAWNRNNVDPVLLSVICDMVIIVVQDKKTPKNELRDAIVAITQGGGTIKGIIYNRQF
jgi:tyrosine-protein kinase Etk/Wzc